MSLEGDGQILFVPIMAGVGIGVGLAAAAIALAGAGVVTVQAGARTVIACGRELKQMADENRAMQRALTEAARNYEYQLRRDVQNISDQTLSDSIQARQCAHEERTQILHQLRLRMQEYSAQSIPQWSILDQIGDEVLPTNPPQANDPVLWISPRTGWVERIQRTATFADQLWNILEAYQSGLYQGLFRTDVLAQILAETRKELDVLHTTACDVSLGEKLPDTEALAQVLGNLEYVHQRLLEWKLQTPQRQQQRVEAIEAIERALSHLNHAMQKSHTRESLVGLDIASQTLDDALRAVERCEFTKARTSADAVMSHLEKLESTVQDQRRRNLLTLLSFLKQRVEPLQSIPELQPDVYSWLQECSVYEQLLDTDLDRVWDQVEKLTSMADHLHEQGLLQMMSETRRAFMRIASETLSDMGFEIDVDPDNATLMARQGTRRVYLSTADTGEVAMKLTGYGDASCQDVQRELLTRLEQKGVIGTWHKRFTLTEAADQMVQMLLQAGLDVSTEPSNEGLTILAVGIPNASATVTFDETVRVSQELAELLRRQPTENVELSDIETEYRERRQRYQEQMKSLRLRAR